MAKASTKFGTFGGVFTPSVLTILGVIMYLRLPWVVGNAGLWVALGIIVAAHIISVTTGLSISSIATDKKVGAGGPYYIVSRSLGLPIGGTLGIALFIGLAFAVSLYVIGFSESFLAQVGVDPSVDNIRICGTITLVALTVVTLISTSFAIKTQYVILGAIVLSLISIGLAPEAPAAGGLHLSKPESSAPIAVIFGIFFPAVTGFTTGVNMSGDLRDPKRAIPIGTMAAIVVGLLVYIALAVFVAWKLPVAEMLENTNVLADKARWGWMVIIGIWGATLSSGLGGIMGAPRILQAMSRDRVTPVWFGKGTGKNNEPHRALIVAFAIAEAGILIGELDAIAKVVSIFFIATYGFLNISCAIESWASTDFHPDFRIPRMVSVIGALTCVFVMLQLDPGATAVAAVLFAGLFLYLKRRELALESGDTWEGVWSSLVRWGLEKLDAGAGEQRNWRPNVISLNWRERGDHSAQLAFGAELIRDRGVLTDFRLRLPGEDEGRDRTSDRDGQNEAQPENQSEGQPEGHSEGQIAGYFERDLETEDPWATARAIARFHGFAGLEPNTVLVNWAEHRHDSAGFVKTIDEFVELDYTLMLLARDPVRGFGEHARMDLWWTPNEGSFELSMALTRFLTLSDDWRGAELRFLLLNDDPSRGDALFKSAQRALAGARLTATVKVLNNAIANRPFYDWVRQESGDADLVVLGLPSGPLASQPARISALDELCDDIGSLIVTRGSSRFRPVFADRLGKARGAGRGGRADESMAIEDRHAINLVPFVAPEPDELRAAARELSFAHDQLARDFHNECLALIYSHDAALIEQLKGVVERTFDQLAKTLDEPVVLRQRKQLNKIQSGFLFQTRRAFSEFESDRLTAQVDALEHRIEGWLAALEELEREAPRTLVVSRDPKVLAVDPEDRPGLRRAKRRLRIKHLFQRSQLSYSFQSTPIYSYYLRYRSPEVLDETLDQTASDAYRTLIDLARSISEARQAVDEFALRLRRSSEEAKQELVEKIAERRALILADLEKLLTRTRQDSERSHDLLMRNSRRLAQKFADDVDRVDVRALLRARRRLPKQAEVLAVSLPEVAKSWRKNRQLILNRAALELHNAGFQHRLRAIVERTKDTSALTIQSGIMASAVRLREALVDYRVEVEQDSLVGEARPPKFVFTGNLTSEFDDKRVVEELAREAQLASAELPDAIEVIGDDALVALEDHPFEDSEVLTVSLRQLVDFLVGAEFLGGLREHTARVALAERRAVGVARDVLHLVSFNLGEYDDEDEEQGNELSPKQRVGPIIDRCLTRLDSELDQLRGIAAGLNGRIDAQLEKILDRTEAYAITGSEDSFKLYVRNEQSSALSRVGGLTRWARRVSKRALVGVLYRWSAGVLLARRFQTEQQRNNIVERTLELVNRNSPKPEVVDALPFYYTQPFLGQARVSLDFWVGREAELAEIAVAVRNWKQGRGGALVIVGERHSGKTSLARYTGRRHFETRPRYNILPPRGAGDLALFKARLEKEVGLGDGVARDWDEVFAAIPPGSVIMIHDLELWWERRAGGAAVLEQLTELITRWGDRVLFIIELNVHAYRFISRTIPLADLALAVVDCQPFAAEQLKQIIELRHRSTGLQFRLDERDEDELAAWSRARLFTRYFDYSSGYVGVALQAWISHIDRLAGERLHMRAPTRPGVELFDSLRLEWVALLVQLILHKRSTRARLEQLSKLDAAVVERQLDTLARMGLIHEDKQGTIEINRFVSHLLVESLRARGYL